jgi:hypothetical protein
LFFDKRIKRYVVYKAVSFKAAQAFAEIYSIALITENLTTQLVHMLTLDGPELQYREPGPWVWSKLQRMDRTGAGSKPIGTVVRELMAEQEAPSSEELANIERLADLQQELNKDFDMIGRTSMIMDSTLALKKRKFGPKGRTILVSMQTGKVLGVV